jgi:fibronectin-binding autotransporter adhesin
MSCSPKGLWQNKIPKRNACPPLFKPSGTQFPVEPEFSLIANTNTHTFSFLFNNQPFNSPHPLPFLNSMAYVDGINLRALGTLTSYADFVQVSEVRTPLTWNTSAANASWNLASNWNAATTPHVAGDTAIFGPLFPTAPETVTLDSNPTIGFLTFNNANGVTILPGNPAGSLTFDAGPGATAAITVAAGSHMIGAPLVLNNPLSISLSPGTSLSLSGLVSSGTSGNGLSISGGGTVSLSAANTFSGSTSVSAGTLLVTNPNGSATGTGSVVVQAGGSLGGSGTVAGAVSTVSTGTGPANNGHLAPGFSGTPSTLNLAGGLTLANNSFLDYRLNSNTASGNDLTAVTGDLALGIGGTLDIAAYQNSLAIGIYKLISYSGSLSGSTNGWTIGANNDPAGHTYWLRTALPHEFDLVVGGTAVTWTGRTGGTGAVDDSWSAASTNWANSSNQPIAFPSNVPASFADTNATGGPAPDGVVNVQATGVAPIAVIFNNNNVNYQLNTTANSVNPSQSGVYGMTSVIKNGVGSLTLVGPNSYRGGTVINAGVISLTDDSS